MSPAMRRETEFLAVADGQIWGARKPFATGAQSRIRSSATHHTEGVNQQAVNTVTHDAIPSPPFPALDDKSPARECGERTGQILSRRHFKGDRWPSDHGGGVRWCFQFYARLRTYLVTHVVHQGVTEITVLFVPSCRRVDVSTVL